MKLTSKFTSNTIGLRRRISTSIFSIIFALIFIAMGVLINTSLQGYKNYIDINATIVEITDEQEVYVQYQVDRKVYTSKTNTYSSSYKVGQELQVAYNPNDPSEVVEKSSIMGYLLMVVGLGCGIFGVRSLLSEIKKKKRFDAIERGEVLPGEYDEEAGNSIFVSDIFPGFRPSVLEDEELHEYYFRFFGKANQGHLLETPDRTPIYEAVLTKFRLLAACDYDFVDHRTGIRTPHTIGKTVSTNAGSSCEYSRFSFDGENIFDIFKSSGYTVDTEFVQHFTNSVYTIYYQGQKIGEIHSAGTSIVPGVKSNKFTNLGTTGLYKIYCVEDNIPIMFLYALAFSRSDMRVYD